MAQFQNCSGVFKSLRKLRRARREQARVLLSKNQLIPELDTFFKYITQYSSRSFLNENSCSTWTDLYEI